MATLNGKTALVTGGSRGFGRGIVEALAAQGANVTAVARDSARLAQLKADSKSTIETISADVTDEIQAAIIMRRIRPDILVLNAGTQAPYRVSRHHTWETFSHVWNVDVKGTFLWAREALLLPLAEGSTIVIVSSLAAKGGGQLIGGYAAAKAGQWLYARSLAQEAKSFNIHVHCLLPNLTPHTDLGRDAIETFAWHAGISEDEFVDTYGFSPSPTPETIGAAVVDLIMDPKYQDEVTWAVRSAGLQSVNDV